MRQNAKWNFSYFLPGLPDPPVNVQVEQGPQDGTLLVTWLPVPTNPASTLISPVIGYAVFAAGKKVAEIDSPTGIQKYKYKNFITMYIIEFYMCVPIYFVFKGFIR